MKCLLVITSVGYVSVAAVRRGAEGFSTIAVVFLSGAKIWSITGVVFLLGVKILSFLCIRCLTGQDN